MVPLVSSPNIHGQVTELNKTLRRAGVSFKGQRVLVTGGSGFLGSWICDVLVLQDAEVVCIDNFSSGHPSNIEHLRGKRNFNLIEHDITKPIELDGNFDLVMHLASRASPLEFASFPIQILKANTLGIWVALGIAKRHESRFLFTSTSEVYGNPTEGNVPTAENYNGNINPIGLRGCYDEAKRCGEAFVFAYHRQHGLDTRIARIFNTYGPRLRAGDTYGRVVSRFVSQALRSKSITIFGDGRQTRSFLYVTDQVEGLLRLAAFPNLTGQVINIGSEEEIRIIELAQLIKRLTESNSPITFLPLPVDDPVRRCPDISRAREYLKWSPSTKLDEGLKMTAEWFKGCSLN
ncbi:MAG: SDR family oxidoreductase [Candidatus Bathyarchaeota archaeon]|nr:MAG: SDR family oxidoreductase [Candidatus Bathyarchaeota archaeon]